MEDRFYYRELECYIRPEKEPSRKNWENAYFDLSLLPTETMKEEFRRYIRYRGTQVALNTIRHDNIYFRQFCQALKTRRSIPESLLDWKEEKWIQLLKAWMMQNDIPLTREKKNVYGKVQVVEARLTGYIRTACRFLQPEDGRPEREKDIWELEKLDVSIEQNPIYKTDTLNFTGILQEKLREEVKLAVYQHLKYEKLGTVKRELTSLRQFSRYLKEKQIRITSCKEIDRDLLEGYLIFKATNGSSGRGNSDDILKLRSVLETVGKLCGYPHLEKLFLNTDIPPELEPEFRAYSDSELKRLNAHITKLDEQITRCMVIHQMLGTRISDTLTLQRDCLFQLNGVDMIRIRQVKTRTFEKPVSAELAALIRKAMEYTQERFGETVYIFVDERDTRRPLQYTTIKHKVLSLIQREDLRDDEGKHFRFGTHMFRRSYGVKLTELHLDDWTIAKLLGHKGVNAVTHYRKMSNQILADETRRAREAQTRILLANLEGWGEDYEQIRQDG